MTATPPPEWRATLGRHVSGALVRSLYAARAHGAEHVPLSGPVIFAANHTGYLDGAVVFGLAPRPAHFLVLASTFDLGIGPLLHLSGQIPLEQGTGDRRALTSALGVLQRGGVVGIFPEGGRGRGDLAKAREGRGLARAPGFGSGRARRLPRDPGHRRPRGVVAEAAQQARGRLR